MPAGKIMRLVKSAPEPDLLHTVMLESLQAFASGLSAEELALITEFVKHLKRRGELKDFEAFLKWKANPERDSLLHLAEALEQEDIEQLRYHAEDL
jgi:hypothetical protein